MDRLIEGFLQDLELSGKTEGTARHYGSCLLIFTKYLEGNSVLDVDKENLRRFIGYLKGKRRALRRLRIISQFYQASMNIWSMRDMRAPTLLLQLESDTSGTTRTTMMARPGSSFLWKTWPD